MFNIKKRYFKKKLEGVKKMIWDLEFKRFKVMEIREGIRQEYDNLKSKLNILEAQIKAQKEKPTMEAGEIAKLDDKKVLLERDIHRMEEQMKGLDVEVNGVGPTAEYHDGVTGINQQIDALVELRGMLKSYVDKEI